MYALPGLKSLWTLQEKQRLHWLAELTKGRYGQGAVDRQTNGDLDESFSRLSEQTAILGLAQDTGPLQRQSRTILTSLGLSNSFAGLQDTAALLPPRCS